MSADQQAARRKEAQDRIAQAATYTPGPDSWLALRSAAGSWVYDITGSRYLDFGPGGAVSLLGHYNHFLAAPIREQVGMDLYPGSPGDVAGLYHGRYVRELSRRFPLVDGQPQQVLVCSSVAEARETLRRWCPGGVLEIRAIAPTGPLKADLVRDLVQDSRTTGQLVVADETVTGFGRTGTFLASEQLRFTADVVMLGPSGGGGAPFAALVASRRVFERASGIEPGFVSPLACAAALGVLAGLTAELLEHVRAMGALLERLVGELAVQFPQHVVGCTGVGLLRRLTLADPARAGKLWEGCRDQGLILGPDLTLTPPLTVSEDEIAAAADVLADVLLEWDTP